MEIKKQVLRHFIDAEESLNMFIKPVFCMGLSDWGCYIIDNKNLTKKQKRMADALTNISYNETLDGICERFLISKETLYNWLSEENFRRYMDLILNGKTFSAMNSVWKSLLKQCDEGNIQAIKLYFELNGKYKGERNTNENSNFIQIIDDIPKL